MNYELNKTHSTLSELDTLVYNNQNQDTQFKKMARYHKTPIHFYKNGSIFYDISADYTVQ